MGPRAPFQLDKKDKLLAIHLALQLQNINFLCLICLVIMFDKRQDFVLQWANL